MDPLSSYQDDLDVFFVWMFLMDNGFGQTFLRASSKAVIKSS